MISSPQNMWRLIDSNPADGYRNMAVDEALLASFEHDSSEPVFRVYSWSPPALSIGRFQNVSEEIDLDGCYKDDLLFVRRITGGGALFHMDEITYSIICSPDQIPGASSVKDSFRILTGFLLEFYKKLGLDASYAIDSATEHDALGVRTPFCFAGKETFDILVSGRKIGGNAQRRKKDIIFQHGSIPIVDRAHTGLRYMKDKYPVTSGNPTSLMDCGIQADFESLRYNLIESFSCQMGATVYPSGLTDRESALADVLMSDKYSTEQWNLRGEVR